MKITKTQLRKIIREELFKEAGFYDLGIGTFGARQKFKKGSGADPWTKALDDLADFLEAHEGRGVKVNSDKDYVSLVAKVTKELEEFNKIVEEQWKGSFFEAFINDMAKPWKQYWKMFNFGDRKWPHAWTAKSDLVYQVDKLKELLGDFEHMVGYGFRPAGSDGQVSDDFLSAFREWRQKNKS